MKKRTILPKHKDTKGSSADAAAPIIIYRREKEIAWTKENGLALAGFLASETGQKIMMILEDRMIMDLLGEGNVPTEVKELRAYVIGKKRLLNQIQRHAVAGPASVGDQEKDGIDQANKSKEQGAGATSPMQDETEDDQ